LDVPPLPDATTSHLVPGCTACGVLAGLVTSRRLSFETPGFVGPGFSGAALFDKSTS
jgi:hypothetical protein